MRRLLIITIVLGLTEICNASCAQQGIDDHIDQICRRWYLVERLTKPMQLIEHLYKQHQKQLLPLDDLPLTITIADPLVNDCLHALMKGKSIAPAMKLWQQIRSYKYPSNITLPGDFAVLICILIRHCCIRLHQLHLEEDICSQIQVSYEKLVSWDTVQVIDLITRVTHYLKGKKFACLVVSNRTNATPVRGYIDIGTKDISLRFCLASRLKKTFDWLGIFKKKKISFFQQMMTRDQSSVVVDEYVTLHHPRIVLCCREMAQTESLAPFVALWKQFKRFEEIHDMDFLKDFLKLVFVTYHYLFLGNLVQKSPIMDNLVHEMHDWSTHLNEYSLIQILEVIDVIEHSCEECKVLLVPNKPSHNEHKKRG